MKKAKIITLITILISIIFLLFAFPAVNISLGKFNFHADGLNIATITNGKYDKEIKFSDGLDIRGGKKYNFEVDLNQELLNYYTQEEIQNLDVNKLSQESVNKLAARLNKIGIKDFDLSWFIDKDNTLHITLIVANKNEDIEESIPLLAGKGDIEFYSQDPNYVPDENSQDFNFFDGIRKIDISRDDIDSFKSIYSSKANGYGFKVVFKKEATSKLLNYIQAETTKGTMLFIDGQPIAVRSYQVENITSGGSKKPIMYMASFFADSFVLDDTLEAIYETGPLAFDIKFIDKQSVSPLLGYNFESNLKFTLFVTFFMLSLFLIYKYKKFGIYMLVSNLIYLIFNAFILKLFAAELTLPLLLGQMVAFALFLISTIDMTSKLKESNIASEKEIDKVVSALRKDYKVLTLINLTVIVFFSFTSVMEVSFFANGLGVGIVVSLLLLYTLTSGVLKIFLYKFNK